MPVPLVQKGKTVFASKRVFGEPALPRFPSVPTSPSMNVTPSAWRFHFCGKYKEYQFPGTELNGGVLTSLSTNMLCSTQTRPATERTHKNANAPMSLVRYSQKVNSDT
ncbi:hypothetical protein SB6419_02207 [Klebsiella spallanzanii]|nr:hypothetical protein SB6419_02207 [Klebsiella spallanzanii]